MGVWMFTGGLKWTGDQFATNPGTQYELPGEEDRTVQLSAGDILCSGFVDEHCHLWAPGAAKLGHICTQQLSSSGVVAAIDFGSYGYNGWEEADRFWRATSSLFIRSFLNICPEGQFTPAGMRRTPGRDISVPRLVETYKKAEGRLLGFKLHLGFGEDATDDSEWLKVIREAGDKAGAKIGVHLTHTHLQMAEIVPYLHSGDILIHIYHGKRGAPLEADGSYSESLLEARKRGVLMDCATGMSNFSWHTFKSAAAKGFYPDFYANDMTFNSWQDNVHRDMPHLISSFAAIGGVPLEEIFTGITRRAADLMGVKYSFDCLTVLRRKDLPLTVVDSLQHKECGEFQFEMGALLRYGECWIDRLG